MQLTSINCEVTSLCNSNCIMCPVHDIRRDAFMPHDKFKKIVDEGVKLGAQLFSLCQYGEPLLDKLLEEKVAYIREKGARSFFFTNASLLSPERSRGLLEAGLNVVAFSVDAATKETYEKIRRGLNWEEVKENIQYFLDHKGKCWTRIHMTVLPDNEHEVEAIKTVWTGIDAISYQPCEGRNEIPAYQDRSTPGPCTQPFCAMIVLSNGESVPCCQDWNCEVPLGNVFEQGVEAVWRGRRYKQFRYKHVTGRKKEIPICARCKSTY